MTWPRAQDYAGAWHHAAATSGTQGCFIDGSNVQGWAGAWGQARPVHQIIPADQLQAGSGSWGNPMCRIQPADQLCATHPANGARWVENH